MKASRLNKRCSSLSEIDHLEASLSKDSSRKSSKDSSIRFKVNHKAYRGRLSLGKPVVSRVHRRKSFNRDSQYFEDDGEETDHSHDNRLALSPVASQSAFRCIPVIERETSSTSTDSGRISSESYFSISIDETVDNSRADFYANMNNFVSTSKTNNKLVLNQKEHKGRMEQTVTCTIGKKPKDHKHGDVLWLILRAYYSGKEVSGGQDATFEEDKLLFKKRENKWVIMEQISDWKAIPFPTVPHSLEASYMTHITQVRDQVHSLLDRLYHYQSFFPTRKAMLDYVAKIKDPQFMHNLYDRVEVLTGWLNTVDDLFDKISTLADVFEVDHLPNATNIWPRPMGMNQVSISLKDARPVFKEYVGRNRNLKAMKKVLVRVWDVCETSAVKAALLLGKSATYAEAASGFKPHVPLTDVQKERYDSSINGTNSVQYGCAHEEFSRMNLPSFLPIFQFILGVRQELIQEWLTIRSNFVGVDEVVDSLTLAAIIEDSRDCLSEAIRVKLHYLDVMHGIGMGTNYSAEFDDCLKDVFGKYLDYVFRWTDTVASSGDLNRLFDELFREWVAASTYACSIPSGMQNLTTTYTSIIKLLVDRLVIEYWEHCTERIAEDHSTADIRISDEYESDDDRFHHSQTSILPACREHARVIRHVKDRLKRIFTLLRDTMLKDLNNSAAFKNSPEFTTAYLAGRLRKSYVMIRFGDYDHHQLSSLRVAVFIEHCYAENAEKLIRRSLCECRKIEGLGYLLVLPYADLRHNWDGKTVRVNIDEEAIMAFHYLRTDYIFVVGDFDCNNTYHHLPNCLEKELAATSSNDNVADTLEDLTQYLMDKTNHLWNEMGKMKYVYEHDTETKRYRETILSTIQQAFDLIIEVHRDVMRIVADSHIHIFGVDMIDRAVEIVDRWHDLVMKMNPQPVSHLPVWANQAFSFIAYIADIKWTRLLDNATFSKFTKNVEECQSLIVSIGPTDQWAQKRNTRTSSFVARARKQSFSPLGRRARLKDAAVKTDEITQQRNRMNFMLGRVVETSHRSKFDLSAQRERKPPFKWMKWEKIGGGSFADVYKALNCDDKCVIAVKKLHVEKKQIPKIESEIEIFSNLKHENLVKYHGFQVIQEDIYILMEYCAEGTLEKICREVMDMTLVRMYTNSLLKAITYLHGQKVLHRDIKPANIFLDLRSRLKLGDFGCSVRLREQDTVRGEFAEYAGTPQYMAPEVQTYGGKMEDGKFRGYGRAVDIWSLGCVVLQMVTGRLPWPDCQNSYQITMLVCTGIKPPYPTNSPAILTNFLDSCLQTDPELRKTADELLQDAFANVHVDVDTVYASPNGLSSPVSP